MNDNEMMMMVKIRVVMITNNLKMNMKRMNIVCNKEMERKLKLSLNYYSSAFLLRRRRSFQITNLIIIIIIVQTTPIKIYFADDDDDE